MLIGKGFAEFPGYGHIADLIEERNISDLLLLRESDFNEFGSKEKFSVIVALRKLEPTEHEVDFIKYLADGTLEGYFSSELYLPFFPSSELGKIALNGNEDAILKLLQTAEWAGGGLGEGIWFDSMKTIARNPEISFNFLETEIENRGRIWGSMIDWHSVWSDADWRQVLAFLEANKKLYPACHSEVFEIYNAISNK